MFFQIISGSYWSYIASLSIRNICFMYYYCPHFKSRVNIALLSFCSVLLPVVTSFTEKELIFFSSFHVFLLVRPSITCFAVCYLFVPVLPFVRFICFALCFFRQPGLSHLSRENPRYRFVISITE